MCAMKNWCHELKLKELNQLDYPGLYNAHSCPSMA